MYHVILLVISKYKDIQLSKADEKPEFSFKYWVTMCSSLLELGFCTMVHLKLLFTT